MKLPNEDTGTPDETLALNGIKVLDVGTMTPGKYCTYLLANLGADVIRVERPVSGKRKISDEDLILNQGKRSITLNLRDDRGKALFLKLATETDVIIEGNRPGVADRNGMGYKAIKAKNPAIIYCALSGFGATGPLSQSPGYDLLFMGLSGMLRTLSGEQAVPINPHTYIADAVSGLTAAHAISTALHQRNHTGKGTFIDLAMLDSLFSLLAVSHGTRKLSEKDVPLTVPSEQPASPVYDIYAAADGTFLVLAAFRKTSQQALFNHLGRGDLVSGGATSDIRAFLRETFRMKSAEAWVTELTALDIEIGVVNHPTDAFDNPQLRYRGMIGTSTGNGTGQFEFIRPAIRSGEENIRGIQSMAPAIGEQTHDILGTLGITEAEITTLIDEGVC